MLPKLLMCTLLFINRNLKPFTNSTQWCIGIIYAYVLMHRVVGEANELEAQYDYLRNFRGDRLSLHFKRGGS